MADLKRSTKLFMDETRAPVLDPGARKTKTGYFWALARDDRPWGGKSPPGVAFTYAPGRGGQHAERILQGFGGILQVDGYAGYNRLIAAGRIGPGIQLAYCWAHARRKLIEITRADCRGRRGPHPRSLRHRGSDPATRLSVRQDRSAPLLARIGDWLAYHRARASAKSPLGEALAYVAKYRDGLGHFLTDGRVEIDNNTVERTIRPIALNRKNALFAGHDAGAENWAIIASLIETCKMNGVDAHAWLSATFTAIVQGHKQSQIDELLPWNWARMPSTN
jgi:transposase